MITVENVSKTFHDPKKGQIKAVDGVSFEAAPGKIFGLLGVNGAGKTTLLRVLSTLVKPTGGTASVEGFDVVKDAEEVRRNIGFLSASTALYGRLTGFEVLDYFAGLYGLAPDRAKERIAFVKNALRLEEFGDQLCDKMSTGQKQRISIARAILHDPPVLFFDEATAGLDVVTAQTVLEFIESTRDTGKTVVFSTHIMSEAERLCDSLAVVHEGKLLAYGTRDSILAETGEPHMERAFLKLVGYEPKRVSA